MGENNSNKIILRDNEMIVENGYSSPSHGTMKSDTLLSVSLFFPLLPNRWFIDERTQKHSFFQIGQFISVRISLYICESFNKMYNKHQILRMNICIQHYNAKIQNFLMFSHRIDILLIHTLDLICVLWLRYSKICEMIDF